MTLSSLYSESQNEYTYLATDLRTHEVIADLPFSGCTYSNKLSDIGELSSTLKINDDVLKLSPDRATLPGKTGLYVLRDGKPVWGGIIWGRQYAVESRQLSVTAQTFESYFLKLFQRQTKYFSDADQLDIARFLIQSRGIQDRLQMDLDFGKSGVLRERTMFKHEFKTIGEELEQLSALLNGFDYGVEITADDETQELRRTLRFYYPGKGLTVDTSTLRFEYPGVIKTFNTQWDAKDAGNFVWTIGAGEGTEQLEESASDEKELSDGYPLLEISRSYKSVYKFSTLKSHAERILSLKHAPISVYSVTLRTNADPPLGSYSVGDWAQFSIEDAFLGKQLTWQRIVEISTSVDTSGIETVTLTLDGGEEPIEEENEIV